MPRAGIWSWLTVCAAISILTACGPRGDRPRESGAVSGEEGAAGSAESGGIPLGTKSDEARALYQKGLGLADQLRPHDARQVLEQAVAKDPDFAMAHYQLALNSPTTKEFRAQRRPRQVAGIRQKRPPPSTRRMPASIRCWGTRISSDSRTTRMRGASCRRPWMWIPISRRRITCWGTRAALAGERPEAEGAFKKALSIDAHFLGSHFGIASALIFQGKHDQALAEAQKMERAARNGGDRRFAMFTRTLAYVDQGKTDRALGEMQKQYQLGAKAGDTAAMAGDLVQMGDILLNAGKADEAGKRYQQALDLQEKSSLSSEVKEDARLAHRYETGRVALKKNDLAKAKSEAAAYLAGATAKQNPGRITQAHALAGGIALKEKNFDQAITHLEQANQQDPYVLYKLGLAYEGTGDAGRAAEMFKQAAESYTLPTLNYVFIRAKAKEKAAPRATS